MLLTPLLLLSLWFGQQQSVTAPDLSAAHQAELARDFAGAEAIYSQLIASSPSALVYERLGLVRHMQDKYDSAAEAFRNAIKLDASLWTSQLFLGIDLYRLNRFDEAAAHLDIADLLHPGEQETLFWHGATALARRDYMAGFIYLENFRKRDPHNPEVLQMLAEAYAAYGTSLLNDVGNRFPDTAAGLIVQAKALEFEGSYAAALAMYRSAQALAPERQETKDAIVRVELLMKTVAPAK